MTRQRVRFAHKSSAYARFLAFAVFATATMVFYKEDLGTIKFRLESKRWGARKIANFFSEKNWNVRILSNVNLKIAAKCNVRVLNLGIIIEKILFRQQYSRPEPSAWSADCQWERACRRTLSMLRWPNIDLACARALPMAMDILEISLINVND